MAEIREPALSEEEALARTVPCENTGHCGWLVRNGMLTAMPGIGEPCGPSVVGRKFCACRLEAARRAQGEAKASVDVESPKHTNPPTAPVFVPPVGARVRIEGIPGLISEDYTGLVVTVELAERSGKEAIWLTANPAPWRALKFERLLCRVSPLPASAIEVECPYADGTITGTNERTCGGHAGKPCTAFIPDGVPFGSGRFHTQRERRFASLTGKDSGRSDPACSDRTAHASAPKGGGSGTGRPAAAGGAYQTPGPVPAAPSGFKLCSVPKCGRPVEHRFRNTGIDPASDATPEFKAHCARLNEAASMCGDHAELHVRAPKVARLRTDLDRPLPKAQAALKSWPSTWRSPSWESDP